MKNLKKLIKNNTKSVTALVNVVCDMLRNCDSIDNINTAIGLSVAHIKKNIDSTHNVSAFNAAILVEFSK